MSFVAVFATPMPLTLTPAKEDGSALTADELKEETNAKHKANIDAGLVEGRFHALISSVPEFL